MISTQPASFQPLRAKTHLDHQALVRHDVLRSAKLISFIGLAHRFHCGLMDFSVSSFFVVNRHPAVAYRRLALDVSG